MTCLVCGLRFPDLGEVGRRVQQAARLMVGVGDYDAYVAHWQATHPDQKLMSKTEFFRRAQDRRYGGGPNGTFRCC
jgi:uncharacterized short protein YbdD (DUF466 family)